MSGCLCQRLFVCALVCVPFTGVYVCVPVNVTILACPRFSFSARADMVPRHTQRQYAGPLIATVCSHAV